MSMVEVAWVQGDQFVASGTGGHSIVLDAPAGREAWRGFKPSDLLLAALAGCTAVDVIDILRKMRQQVSGMHVSACGEQHATYPMAFERIALRYKVRGRGVSPAAVECAISLSQGTYCSVAATIRGVAAISTSFDIREDDMCPSGATMPEDRGDAL